MGMIFNRIISLLLGSNLLLFQVWIMPLLYVWLWFYSSSRLTPSSNQRRVEGDFIQAFGTFAAAPVVASILSIVNDARITVGKKPIGFINPTVSLFLFNLRFSCVIFLSRRFTPIYSVTKLSMISHLEATTAAAEMGTLPFQDGYMRIRSHKSRRQGLV